MDSTVNYSRTSQDGESVQPSRYGFVIDVEIEVQTFGIDSTCSNPD